MREQSVGLPGGAAAIVAAPVVLGYVLAAVSTALAIGFAVRMPRPRRPRPPIRALAGLVVVASATLFAGCSAAPVESATSVVDYERYESVEALRSEADLIVEVELGGPRNDVLMPEYSGVDPRLNPFAGTDETPVPGDGALAITVYEASVIAVHDGDAEVGDSIDVAQMGGTLDGVHYVFANVASLTAGVPTLLFLETPPDAPAFIVGEDQGAFELDGDTYRSLGDGGLSLSRAEAHALG